MATYYISPTGDDSTGDGSEGNPWFNFVYAISTSQTAIDDTIIVKEGTYVQTLGGDDFSIDNRTIISENNNPSATILDFDGIVLQQISSDIGGSISGITFKNNGTQDSSRSFIKTFNGLYIRNCIFENIRNQSGPRGRGGLFTGSDTLVDSCLFIDCFNKGSDDAGLIASSGGAFNMTLSNCTVYYNVSNVPLDEFMPNCFVRFDDGPTNVRIMTIKNLILEVVNGSITNYNSSDPNDVNTVVTTTYSCIHNANYTDGETGVITSDPLLVDPDNSNFNLRPNSPCIGTGTLL